MKWYTSDHEWIEDNGNGIFTIGITKYAAESLGEIVFVELPSIGSTFSAGDSASVVESVKAASDIYSPISGDVVETNDALNDQPDLLNSDPEDTGWIWKIENNDINIEDMEFMNEDEYALIC